MWLGVLKTEIAEIPKWTIILINLYLKDCFKESNIILQKG